MVNMPMAQGISLNCMIDLYLSTCGCEEHHFVYFSLTQSEIKLGLKWTQNFNELAGEQEKPSQEIGKHDSMEGKGGAQEREGRGQDLEDYIVKFR